MKKILFLFIGLSICVGVEAQSPKNLRLLGSLHFPGQRLSGCWHYNKPGGGEYAIVGAENGIVIIDITNPATPINLFQLPGASSLWHEVKVNGDYAYAVSEGFDPNGINNGLQIIDLRFLPDSAPNKFYQGEGLIANQLFTSHSITTNSHYLYLNGHNISNLGNGVLILDISTPDLPVYLGAVTNRYCHDSYVRGDTIYTSDIRDGLFTVYDISNPATPIQLATQFTPGLFNHNAWLSDDSKTLYTVDERPNTPLAAYDVFDLNNITLLDTFYNGKFPTEEVHNVRVLNDFLVNPSYGSQLTLVDAARPMNLIEVGNHETGNYLCWDADPYTLSGNIIATDMDAEMFFVFAPTYIRACYLEGIITDSVTGFPINNADVEIQTVSVLESSDAAGIYRTGYADSGSYTVLYSKAGYISRIISVPLQNGILTTLDVKLVPIGAVVEEISENSISVFPNPANDIINVSSEKFDVMNWEIIDERGRIISNSGSNFNKTNNFSIDISHLSSGLYTINLESINNKIVKSFLKRK